MAGAPSTRCNPPFEAPVSKIFSQVEKGEFLCSIRSLRPSQGHVQPQAQRQARKVANASLHESSSSSFIPQFLHQSGKSAPGTDKQIGEGSIAFSQCLSCALSCNFAREMRLFTLVLK